MGVFFWEFSLYTYNCDKPQIIVFDAWDIQELRLTIILLSALAIFVCELWKGVKA
jgi:hypothetical protein